MKILIVNRNYFVTGGPEKYMFSLMKNMPQHKFIPFCVDFEQNFETPYRKYFVSPPSNSDRVYFNDFKMSPVQKITYACNSIYYIEARRKLEKLIKEERPDLALFLNAVYFSDSIIDACRRNKVPIIWRLSDFHKICANYLLYRDGHACEDCLEHGLSKALRNRCGGYQRSLAAALIKVAGMWLSKKRKLYNHVDYFITPSAFTREKMIQGGFVPGKVVHIPTFVDADSIIPATYPDTPGILYVGRLSPEKGVAVLIKAFSDIRNKDAILTIAGETSGDYARQLMNDVPANTKNRIRFPGFQNQQELKKLYSEHSIFVVPSVCYENLPNVVLEGMAHARPSVVSRLGSLTETVKDGETGFHFEANSAQDLALKLDYLIENKEIAKEMGKKARTYVIQAHALHTHIDIIETLFKRCMP
jgi:glycosyltransferase involved in cell wall biosynthesis